MIDTDKYEGHAEGDWNWTKLGTFTGILLDKHGKDIVHLMMPYDLYSNPTDATAQLIADAPKLLAEVTRLRELLKITAQSYLDSVRTEDMLGEVSVKKDYEICKSIGNAIGARIVWESRTDENTGHDTVYEHPYFTYEEEEE